MYPKKSTKQFILSILMCFAFSSLLLIQAKDTQNRLSRHDESLSLLQVPLVEQHVPHFRESNKHYEDIEFSPV